MNKKSNPFAIYGMGFRSSEPQQADLLIGSDPIPPISVGCDGNCHSCDTSHHHEHEVSQPHVPKMSGTFPNAKRLFELISDGSVVPSEETKKWIIKLFVTGHRLVKKLESAIMEIRESNNGLDNDRSTFMCDEGRRMMTGLGALESVAKIKGIQLPDPFTYVLPPNGPVLSEYPFKSPAWNMFFNFNNDEPLDVDWVNETYHVALVIIAKGEESLNEVLRSTHGEGDIRTSFIKKALADMKDDVDNLLRLARDAGIEIRATDS